MSVIAFAADQPDQQATAESQQYLAEEKADLERNGDPELAYSDRTGKLVLYTKEQIEAIGDSTIVGTFECDGATHFVRLVSERVKKSLEKLNKKTCTLQSKLRNNGKYIYVKAVVLSGPAAPAATRPGGL